MPIAGVVSRVAAAMLLAVAWVVPCALAEDDLQRLRYIGYAYDVKSGELLYQEQHTQQLRGELPVSLDTVYRGPDGEPFAQRQVTYGDTPSQPVFEFVDDRRSYAEGSYLDSGERVVFKRKQRDVEQAKVKFGRRPMVIDAGFDRFILERWEQLQKGKTVKFDFLNAARLGSIAFRIRKTGDRQTEYGAATDFEMDISNFLLRMLLDPIKICYLNQDKSLYQYKGISNIKGPDNKNYVVRIEYPRDQRSLGTVEEAPAELAE